MELFHLAFELGIALLAALISIFTGRLMFNISRSPQAVMTRFKLQSEATLADFRYFLVGEVLLLFSFLLYPVSGFTGNTSLMVVARISLVVFLAVVTYGFARMWRRSR